MIAPIDSSTRGPKRSTRKPWNGEKNVCSTMRIENVTCNVASSVPSFPNRGLVKSAQTYCGLEIAIMQMTPSAS